MTGDVMRRLLLVSGAFLLLAVAAADTEVHVYEVQGTYWSPEHNLTGTSLAASGQEAIVPSATLASSGVFRFAYDEQNAFITDVRPVANAKGRVVERTNLVLNGATFVRPQDTSPVSVLAADRPVGIGWLGDQCVLGRYIPSAASIKSGSAQAHTDWVIRRDGRDGRYEELVIQVDRERWRVTADFSYGAGDSRYRLVSYVYSVRPGSSRIEELLPDRSQVIEVVRYDFGGEVAAREVYRWQESTAIEIGPALVLKHGERISDQRLGREASATYAFSGELLSLPELRKLAGVGKARVSIPELVVISGLVLLVAGSLVLFLAGRRSRGGGGLAEDG